MKTATPKNNALTALFNKTCVSILSFLYNNADTTFYLREIARRTGIGAGTTQREISKLVDASLVVRQARGRQVYYGANTKSQIYNEIRGLIIKTFGLADVIRDALYPHVNKMERVFIYGSQADGTATSDSDIDLMVVGKIGEMELHKAIDKAERKLGRAINYSLFTSEEFKKRKKQKDGFIDRVAHGKKIVLIGDENEI